MGDEGIGIHILNRIKELCPMPDINFVDGGTGGLNLLEYFTDSVLVVVIDAAMDGKPVGTLSRLAPEYSSDYPPTLVSHDIGLKDMLDAVYLLEKTSQITLFTVSIDSVSELSLDLSDKLRERVQSLAESICAFLHTLG